jgi:hypothetical protein
MNIVRNKIYLVVPVPHSPLKNARSSHLVPSDKVHIPYWPPVHSKISNVHHFSWQLTDAGFARLVVPVATSVPVAYTRHFGSAGVSQYINVQASAFPSLTEQVLHPSK